MIGGKHLYHIHGFIAGVATEIPANTLLTVGNYYAVVIKYVDTDVSVFGADTTFSTSYYENGYAWKAEVADDFIDKIDGAAGSGAFSDLMFVVYSTQDVFIIETEVKFNETAGDNAEFQIFIEDSGMKITDIVTGHESMFGTEHEENMQQRPSLMQKGGKIECYYNDDPTDSISLSTFEFRYYFVPQQTNG